MKVAEILRADGVQMVKLPEGFDMEPGNVDGPQIQTDRFRPD